MSIAHALPAAPTTDGTQGAVPTRTDSYGEAWTRSLGSKQDPFAAEGTYYVVKTTTSGTGIAGHAAPVAADLGTKALIHVFNPGPLRICVDYVKVRMTAIGAGATTTDFASWMDQSGATNKSSGGTVVTAQNTNSSSGNTCPAIITFGAVVVVSVAQKQIGYQRVRSVVPVVEDQYFFNFGAPNAAYGSMITSGTLVASLNVPMPPADIAPLACWQLSEWGVSQSGAHSFDMEVGFWYR